jgi:hypothetical protein
LLRTERLPAKTRAEPVADVVIGHQPTDPSRYFV